MKKILIVLSLLFAFCIPSLAYAETKAGKWGSNISWDFSEDKTLTISGNGKMTPADTVGEYPWSSFDIHTLVLKDGIQSIPKYAFGRQTNLNDVSIPNGVKTIGKEAFANCGSLT